ncbi:MAG TPA: hypothetical protein DEG17_08805 [Cyanobacteria bacterium UBA11149]|nr:hypothetical protein [Cyanobacteria bacterium UBA11367]HBE61123.1 hypothetical protein [Cyanobacteria bacterium UBA11366]HBK62003.1 hypothetical protein [Cyanobacteria bacterium UBA11166]HBR74577.1 hypothetical protein [Cyanobacteria bacterium UBA11159]HBS71579.1 hypothetical protein [Cyanobacteria bacterium UBA11153]HBW88955.1 hypothetical protein [Cyanobacteria bacterium UBA11149]HCA95396.1 hypothetical protein [Cyanobacteria bacterium UBA9226]
MFLDELTPILKEMILQPIAFLGGFCAGVLRLNLSDDPVKTWLQKQSGSTYTVTNSQDNGKSKGPQSISIE